MNIPQDLHDGEIQKTAELGDELGANFELPTAPPLTFATKCRVWGDDSGTSREPVAQAFPESDLKQSVLAKDEFRCHFCGFTSRNNEVHNLNDNHSDVRPENLQAVDLLCHGWQHLGELADGEASIAYLPGLSPQDINHLQRTMIVALQSSEAEIRGDAKTLLNWLASHRDYTERAWGTHDPAIFADALARQPFKERDLREIVFNGLGVVFHPCLTANAVASWMNEGYTNYPATNWSRVYHDIMNAPL